MKYKTKDLMLLDGVKNIFFVGIKGVGMTPLALIAHEAGISVAGSDVEEEYITDVALKKGGVNVFNGFGLEDVKAFFSDKDKNASLVITTGAHNGFDNPQVIWAEKNGYPVLSQGQALGKFAEGQIFGKELTPIAVAGSHGKTTITAILATCLTNLEEDPSYSVGSGEIFPLGPPGHFGKGEFFVIEADEYASEPVYDRVPKFLYLNPSYAIFNNVDYDHPDFFDSIEQVKEAFLELAYNIKSGGLLLVNGDDKALVEMKEKIGKDIRIITFGEANNCDYRVGKIVSEGLNSKFTVYKKNSEVGYFEINIPGKHNVKNALSVIVLLLELGFDPLSISKSLKSFKGTKRRLEKVGLTLSGAMVYDDYAHHPLEISTSLNALSQAYSEKKIVCIFQPHTFSRTKALLPEFAKSFSSSWKLILLPVFKSQRDGGSAFSMEEFVNACSKNVDTQYFEKFDDVIEYIDEKLNSDEYLIVSMGAGDVYKIAYKIKND